jgi:ABC-type glycerol-3-phosphate transport system permease component
MKQATTGTVSGCLVWVIAFFAISLCILPIATAIGGFTSFSDFAIQQTGAIICPENTTPDVYSYATTTTDEYGNRQPSTAYVLQCKDASGEVVMEDPVGYAFLWTGVIAGIGLILSGVLAFVLAAPAGVLIGKFLNRIKKPG